MKRRHAILSIMVTGALALTLIMPPKEATEEPAQKSTNVPPKPAQKMPIQMAEVILPPPPTFRTETVKAIAPMVAKPAPKVVREPVKAAPPKIAKTIHIKPLAPSSTATKSSEPLPLVSRAKLASEPTPKQAPSPTQSSSKEIKQQGRPLLKLLEFGKGPRIEIAWPDRSSERAKLFSLFRQCYGMRVALMSEAGNLYDDHARRGDPWQLNTDRFSGFVRQSQGRAADAEASHINSIRQRHGLYAGNPVRLFPRETDALLLGGLQSLIGDAYTNNQTIRASYRVSGWRVRVDGISTDGHAVTGSVDLSGAVTAGCRT